MIAFLAHRHEVLLAGFLPPHRGIELARQMANQNGFAVERRLDAEAAALVALRDHTQLVGGYIEHIRHGQAVDMRPLGGDPGSHPVERVPACQDAARLERRDAAAVHAETLLNDDIGIAEQVLDFRFVRRLGLGGQTAGDGLGEYLVAVPTVVDNG